MERASTPVRSSSAPPQWEGDVSLDDVRAAADRIGRALARTPLFTASQLGDRLGIKLALKAELLQKTGSFKPRGALNRLLTTSRADLERGLVTVSAGNHAQGLAWAARVVGCRCTVVMPEDAPASKVAAARAYGAEVVLHGTVSDAYVRMEQLREQRRLVLVHPFDDPGVIAGQGTVALEIAAQAPEVDTIVCPLGGGGLVSGIAIAAKALQPKVRVFGVEPEGAAAMHASWDRGEPVRLDAVETIADGLAAPLAGEVTYPLTRRHVDDVVTVSDDEILAAMRELLSYAKLVAEPAGAAAVAALLTGKVPVRSGEKVVAVVSGGNIDLERLKALL